MRNRPARRAGGPRHFRAAPSSLRRTAGLATLALVGVVAVTLAGAAANGAAGFRDQATLHAEYSASFELGMLSDSGDVVALGGDPLTLEFSPGTAWVPGTTAQLSFDAVNNSPALAAELVIGIAASADDAALAEHVRVTITEQRGEDVTVLAGNPDAPGESTVTLAEAAIGLASPLERRGSAPLELGDAWEGPVGSRAIVTVYLHLLDSPELRAHSSGSLTSTLTMTGRSIV